MREGPTGLTRNGFSPVVRVSHVCYSRRMGDVASRELRNQTRDVLRRVAAGERVRITVNGRPVAVLAPVENRPRWMPRAEFVRRLVQADPGLTDELAELVPDTTDDVGDV
jgi:prevent-host-death family protein